MWCSNFKHFFNRKQYYLKKYSQIICFSHCCNQVYPELLNVKCGHFSDKRPLRHGQWFYALIFSCTLCMGCSNSPYRLWTLKNCCTEAPAGCFKRQSITSLNTAARRLRPWRLADNLCDQKSKHFWIPDVTLPFIYFPYKVGIVGRRVWWFIFSSLLFMLKKNGADLWNRISWETLLQTCAGLQSTCGFYQILYHSKPSLV